MRVEIRTPVNPGFGGSRGKIDQILVIIEFG